jgi:hypothetical protein
VIEAYAFLAAFAVQILVMSVVIPAWTTENHRAKAASSAQRFAQLYPDVDVAQALERYLTQHGVLTSGIAVLGLLLLGWLFSDAWRADWNGDKAGLLALGYFLVAVALPTIQFVRFQARFNKEHKPEKGKRTAILQRRGLFDFVSPFLVSIAVLSYLLFAAFMIYIEQHPFPGFGGALANIGIATLGYAFLAINVYYLLYGKNRDPFETNTGRVQRIGLAVKAVVYLCIASSVNVSITLALQLLHLKVWGPVAASIFFTALTFLCYLGFAAPLSKPEVDELESSAAS